MKYALVPENEHEARALEENPVMKTLFDSILPVLQARSLIVGARIGLFDKIGDDTWIADELARVLSVDADVLCLLLRVLESAGYVESNNGGYVLTAVASITLRPNSPHRLSAWTRLNHEQWDAIGELEAVSRSGTGIDLHRHFGDGLKWDTYQQAMLETARPAAAWVAERIPIPQGAERMLDIGGSHGLYSATICRQHPPLRSEILELPEAVEYASQIVRQEGCVK